LSHLSGGLATAEMAAALLGLHHAVTKAGGDFRVTDCHRSAATQMAARAKYNAWVKAGKPNPPGPGQKAAFVAEPGKSNHNAGRAVDIDIASLKFPGVPADKQLDKLWELAIPLGFTPIIKEAREGASESWHFDFWGDLRHVYQRYGYEVGALCGALLVGHAGQWQSDARVMQAHCHRLGKDVGALDGVIGPKTLKALMELLNVKTEAEAIRPDTLNRLQMISSRAY
jgi:hypothetical protein